MEKLIFRFAMCRNRQYLIDLFGAEWYMTFHNASDQRLREILPQVPDIGKSIFSFSYKLAPIYISWYLALEEMGIPADEIDHIIWGLNTRMVQGIPSFLMEIAGKMYLGGFRKHAEQHIRKQQTAERHSYDWKIKYEEINDHCFEIDILSCGIKKLAELFHAEGMLPGVCRMDYLFASVMHYGFERTNTLGDGDAYCDCRFCEDGTCEWSPEKGFINRK